MTKNEKNQLYCLCLKMTADFGNFVSKNDKKQKMKWTRQKPSGNRVNAMVQWNDTLILQIIIQKDKEAEKRISYLLSRFRHSSKGLSIKIAFFLAYLITILKALSMRWWQLRTLKQQGVYFVLQPALVKLDLCSRDYSSKQQPFCWSGLRPLK